MIRASSIGVLIPTPTTYSVFTRKHDVERHARDALAEIEKDRPGSTEYYLKLLQECFDPGSIPPDLSSQKPSLLKRLVQPSSASKEAPVTLLLDCSGSMRGRKITTVIAALMLVGDALSRAGRTFEILGFTTATWTGGEPNEEWIEAGRHPKEPGRLCPLLHITFKSFEDDWAASRNNLLYALHEGLLKENIDGEALEWAAGRALAKAQKTKPLVVLISDGAPIDAKTLGVNPSHILEAHLQQVIADLEQKIDLRIAYVPNSNEPSSLHPDATVLDTSEFKTRADLHKAPPKIASMLADLIAKPAP